MAHPSAVSLCGAATVFVVQDVLRSVEHFRDVLGFHTEFTYGQPTFYAGVERDGVVIHLQAASETKRQPGHGADGGAAFAVKPREEPISRRGSTRRPLRAWLLLGMTTLAGTLPIAVGIGAGADARRSLGLAMVGGLVLSQLLTLYITPVIDLYLEAARERLGRRRHGRRAATSAEAPQLAPAAHTSSPP